MSTTTDTTTAPFGHKRRDWTFLFRATVIILSLFSAGGIGIYLYAGASYVRDTAKHEVIEHTKPYQTLPGKVQRLEELSVERAEILKDLAAWRRSKDDIDTRLTILIENQQRQIERQQLIMDRLAERVK